MNHRITHGQVLLITVLVLSIAITIALSLIGRGVTDVSMSKNMEESARAFSAAEAGIEEALNGTIITDAKTYASGVTYQSSSSIIGGTTGAYTLPVTNLGEVASVWLVDHTSENAIDESNYYAGTSLDICWTKPTDGTTPAAIEVTLYYKSGGTYMIQRGAYDPDILSRPSSNFSSITDQNGTCGTVTNAYRQTIALPGGVPYLLRVRPFYHQTAITIAPIGTDITLPKQGIELTSTGKTDSGITRKIVVKRQYPAPPSVFDYSVYSQNSFIH